MAGSWHGGDSSGHNVAVTTASEEALTALFREESGRLTASLVRVLGDFAVAEEVVADALMLAWRRWPVDGIPGNPAGWLWTVARRRAVDHVRRDTRKLALLAAATPEQAEPADEDDRPLSGSGRRPLSRAAGRRPGRRLPAIQ
jgi:predicted RNA polymerase sigma factor